MRLHWLVVFVSVGLQADIEDVVVVAEKRQTTERNVAMSLDVITAEEMVSWQILAVDDINDTAPNLALNQKSAIKSGLAIRGIGTDSFHISGQESVGSFLDEVALVSPFVSQVALWDMDHVEVLRGPQNSLYGRNTIGGAVNYLTRQANPKDELNGKVHLSTGSGNGRRVEAALGARLSETIAIRISAIDEQSDGEWNNLATGDDYGGIERQGVRLNASWQASQQTLLRFTHMQAEISVQSLPQVWLGNLNNTGEGACPAIAIGEQGVGGRNSCTTRITQGQVNGSAYLTEALAKGNVSLLKADPLQPGTYLVNYSAAWGDTWQDPAASHANSDIKLSALRISHDFDAMSFHSVTSHLAYDVDARFSSDLHSFATAQLGDWNVWQQEFRLASTYDGDLDWLVGAYLAHQNSEEDTLVLRTDRAIAPGVLIDNRFSNYSLFGQIDYQLTEALRLTVGLRHSREVLEATRYEKWACNTQAKADDYLTNFPPPKLGGLRKNGIAEIGQLNRSVIEAECSKISFGPIPALRFEGANTAAVLDAQSQTLSETGWNARLAWRGDRNQIMFVTVSNSFKGGAYDNRALGNGSAPVDPEYLTAVEVGYKDQFFVGQLTMDAAVFSYYWDDQQLFEVVGGNPQTLNIKETELLGAELNLDWRMTDNWRAVVALGLLDSEITGLSNDHPTASLAAVGNEITNAPNYSANMSIGYTRQWTRGRIDLEVRSRHIGPQYLLISNSPRSELSSFRMLDLSAAYQFGIDRQYTVRLTGNNLTETQTYSRIAGGPGELAWNVLGSGFRNYAMQLTAEF